MRQGSFRAADMAGDQLARVGGAPALSKANGRSVRMTRRSPMEATGAFGETAGASAG